MQKAQQTEELLPREQQPVVPKSMIDLPHVVGAFVVGLILTFIYNGF